MMTGHLELENHMQISTKHFIMIALLMILLVDLDLVETDPEQFSRK